jgi:predicted NUDIX family NTP pyrophosphohydrolase
MPPIPAKISAGLLIYRRREGDLEVLLAHPGGPFAAKKDEGTWTIPKGEIEGAEDFLERARIEFREELGAEPPPGPYVELGAVKQKGGKTVHAWACEGDFTGPARSNTFRMEWPPRSGQMQEFPEIDCAEWFTLPVARTKINEAQAAFFEVLLRRLEGSA